MGAYREMKNTFAKEYKEHSPQYSQRLFAWRSEPSVVRIAKPTNIARARELGYKAKQGVIMARARVRGGSRKRPQFDGGRKPSKSGRRFTRVKSMQAIAEERAARKFSNYEVLNSYFVGHAGSDTFYEIIMLNPSNSSIARDPAYGAATHRGRAFRGLTRQGRVHRGLA